MNNEHRLRLCGGGCNEQDAQLVLHTDSRLFDWPLDGLFDLGKSMNREDIIRMAREAGLHIATDVNWMPIIGLEYAEKFAALVLANNPPQSSMAWQEGYASGMARERERFTEVLRQLHDSYSLASDSNAIRARGQA